MKKKIALLFGGKSAEHEVSILSAKSIYENIDRDLFDVILIGSNMEGENFIFTDDDLNNLENKGFESAKKLSIKEFISLIKGEIDVVFPALHGPYGEDGKLQGFLDFIDVPYVGCNHTTSAICMDKAYNKYILKSENFSILPFEVIFKYNFDEKPSEILDKISAKLEFPLFIKPANMGSSVGISKVNDKNELKEAIELAFKYDDVVVAEHGIDAAEFECGIFGFNNYKASPVGEIKPSHEFYDYEAKYSEEAKSDISIPAEISEKDAKYIQDECVRAAELFRIRGLSRVDFLMDKNTGKLYLSEINTMPGFTKFSMYPSLAEKMGIPYKELITELIAIAEKN